jgi:hypothetical protein
MPKVVIAENGKAASLYEQFGCFVQVNTVAGDVSGTENYVDLMIPEDAQCLLCGFGRGMDITK